MSAMKCFMEDCISKLSELTGYSRNYLSELWHDNCLEEGTEWYDFVCTTLELDWDEEEEQVWDRANRKPRVAVPGYVEEYIRFDPHFGSRMSA